MSCTKGCRCSCGKNQKFDLTSNLGCDKCNLDEKLRQNQSIHDYNTFNYMKDNCDDEKTREFLFENPNLQMKYGFGYADKCTVDVDSQLRNNSELTQTKCRNQYFTRQFQAVPDLSRGVLAPNTESRLLHGEDTGQKRSCNVLSGVYVDRFTPLVQCLKENIQNPKNIIPDWTWGGAHSRYDVRDKDYLERCGYKFDGKNWNKGEQNPRQENAQQLHDEQLKNYKL